MNKLITSTLVSIGLTAAAVSLAMAQGVTPPATDGAQVHQGRRHQHAKRPFSKPSERAEARLAYMQTALQITDAQKPQWDAFANTLRKQAADRDKQMQERHARMAQGGERRRPTAIERLEFRQKRYAAALTSLNERLAVERPLYAAFSAEQKQVADEVLAPRGRHGGFRHHGGKRSKA